MIRGSKKPKMYNTFWQHLPQSTYTPKPLMAQDIVATYLCIFDSVQFDNIDEFRTTLKRMRDIKSIWRKKHYIHLVSTFKVPRRLAGDWIQSVGPYDHRAYHTAPDESTDVCVHYTGRYPGHPSSAGWPSGAVTAPKSA